MKTKNKKDLIFFAIIAVFLIATLVVTTINKKTEDENVLKAVITVQGQVIGEYPLNKNAEIPVQTDYGYNKVVIKNGTAEVTEADCPDSICVYTYPASERGAVIVCLPHAMMVEIQ